MGEGKTKPSICCDCHGWRMIAMLLAALFQSVYELSFKNQFNGENKKFSDRLKFSINPITC